MACQRLHEHVHNISLNVVNVKFRIELELLVGLRKHGETGLNHTVLDVGGSLGVLLAGGLG
jgi:hypothetical protein